MYPVFKELLELSNKADKVIEKVKFSDENLNEMFLYAKDTMRQIMNGHFQKYNDLPFVDRKISEKKCMPRHSYNINLENKSHVLAKPYLSPVTQKTEPNDSGVVFVSSSDTEEYLICKQKIDNKESDESGEVQKSRKSYFEECKDLMTGEHSVITSVFKTDKICSAQELLFEPSKKSVNSEVEKSKRIDIQESNEIIDITPQNDKMSLDFEEMLHKRRRTRSLTNYCIKMGISLDGSFHKPSDSTDNKGILDRTYVLSSSSSAENTEFFLNRTYVISSTSSEENNECTVISTGAGENAKNTTSAFLSNESDEEMLRKNHDKKIKNKLLHDEEKLTMDEELTIRSKLNNRIRVKHQSILPGENLSNLADLRPKNAFTIQLSTVQCDDIRNSNEKVNSIKEQHGKKIAPHFRIQYQNDNKDFSDINSDLERSNNSKNASQNINKDRMSTSYFERRKYSSPTSSSDDAIPKARKITEFRNAKPKKLHQREFQTNSAPVYRRQLKNQKCMPVTPLGFNLDLNRQSLKEKAEEKRKHRETKVQKAKERRERLQREKEEKSRLNEQRLKQRLEQHEKMLRQKVNKFRMKLRSQQQWNTRRYNSSTSTSSEDSKEVGAKDNGVCRNLKESSQQLSKVGNSYHDMTLKKDAPNSLQGNVGQNPEDSKKHNSNVSCERTPVDLLTNTDVMKSEKTNSIPVCENTFYIKKSGKPKCIKPESSDMLIVNSCSRMKSTVYHIENSNITKSEQKQSKRNKDDRLNKTDSELHRFKSNAEHKLLIEKEVVAERLKESAYFLRSSQKDNVNNTSTSSTSEKSENDEKFIKDCKITTASSENDNCGCNYSCFSSKNPKKNLKNSIKILASSRISTQVGKKKRFLIKPKKGILKKKKLKGIVLKKIKNITSYKISDAPENSFDEFKIDPSNIPSWAKGLYLKQALIQQYYKHLNVEKIFGPIPKEPIDLAEIFQIDKPEYHRRTSSEKWSTTDSST